MASRPERRLARTASRPGSPSRRVVDPERSARQRRQHHEEAGRRIDARSLQDDRMVIPQGLDMWRSHEHATKRMSLDKAASPRAPIVEPRSPARKLRADRGPSPRAGPRVTPTPNAVDGSIGGRARQTPPRTPRSPMAPAPPPTPPSRNRASVWAQPTRTRTDEEVLRDLVGEDVPPPLRTASTRSSSPTGVAARLAEAPAVPQRSGYSGSSSPSRLATGTATRGRSLGSTTSVPAASAGASVSPLQRAARARTRSSVDGSTIALYTAASHGQVGMVKMLLGMGMDVDGRTGSSTSLHAACEQGHDEVVRELMKHGASASIADADGRTPLRMAEEAGHNECAQAIRVYSSTGKPPPPAAQAPAAAASPTRPTTTASASRPASYAAAEPVTPAAVPRRDPPAVTQTILSDSVASSAPVWSPRPTDVSQNDKGTMPQETAAERLSALLATPPRPPISPISGQDTGDSPASAGETAGAPQPSPFSHLFAGKRSTSAKKTSSAVTAELFKEFGVSQPQATVRGLPHARTAAYLGNLIKR